MEFEMAMRSIEGSTDLWCLGNSTTFYYYIISGWIPTQNILALRSGLRRRNKTAAFTVALVWRLVDDTSDTVDDGDWVASPDANLISSGDFHFENFADAATAIAEHRFCQFALKVFNHSGEALNLGQIEYVVEFRG